jgi:hypothetical protein
MASATPTANPAHQTLEWETPSAPKRPGILSSYNLFHSRPTVTPATKEEDPAAERTAPAQRTFFDRFIPHWCAPCFGRNRKTCICALAALLLLALILGLGLGLGLHKRWVNLNTFHPGTPIWTSSSPTCQFYVSLRSKANCEYYEHTAHPPQQKSQKSPSPHQHSNLHGGPNILFPRSGLRRMRVRKHAIRLHLCSLAYCVGCREYEQ